MVLSSVLLVLQDSQRRKRLEESVVPDAWEERVFGISGHPGSITFRHFRVMLGFKDFISDPARAVPVAWWGVDASLPLAKVRRQGSEVGGAWN